MPYVFGFLVLLNAALLGYFLLVPPNDDAMLSQAKSTLVAPVDFANTTSQLPPEIGKN